MIYLIGTLEIKPEQREAFVKAANTCIAETVKEAGCISYEMNASMAYPNRFIFVERWKSRDDLDAHFRAPYLTDFVKASGPMHATPPSIEIITAAEIARL
jgi:quinol monooxygenase YgiN